MEKVLSYDLIQSCISSVRAAGRGFVTNFYSDAKTVELWSGKNQLFFQTVRQTYFIIRKKEGFWNLFYITPDFHNLKQDVKTLCEMYPNEIIVCDIVGTGKSVADPIELFKSTGFSEYCNLVRMSRIIASSEEQQHSIEYATNDDIVAINQLLQQYFDPISEQLPLIEQLQEWVESKHLLVCRENGELAGFLIFDLWGVTSYLRYWFTRPNYRDKKVGSRLLRQFFCESNNTKRQLFWVIKNNENAIKRYKHYGFTEEKMYDSVMLKKR